LTANDEQAVREAIATWQRATVAGDLPRLLSLMTEDVVFLRKTEKNAWLLARDANMLTPDPK
jgi:ketosteroid isomerase-like protein